MYQTEMNASETFFLRSTRQTIVAEGCFKHINVPAVDGARLQGEFQNAVSLAMDEARAAGIEAPIVVGAIPFDPSKPSALYIPRKWRGQSDEETKKELVDSHETTSLKITSSKLLPEHDQFTDIVAKAIEKIRSGALEKVVLSRLHNIETAEPVNSLSLLSRLIEQNPIGFNFHVPLSDNSCLVGSSPELLLEKRGKGFYSQPLAGSAGRKKDAAQDKQVSEELLKSPKDLHEHKLVVDAVRDTLSPRSDDLYVPRSPECISTPKLWHLASSIKGNVNEERENALTLALLLHPTPALSGFPHESARKVLSELEPFDREFFGGIVGYMDSNGNGEWFITIRCGRVSGTGQQIQLFAGAGVVESSVPESEWNETGIKLTTMLHAFDLA